MIYCKSTKYNENLMLMNLTNKKKNRYIKTIVNKRDLCVRKVNRQYVLRETAVRGP